MPSSSYKIQDYPLRDRDTMLQTTKGFKFVETIKATIVKRKDNKNIYKPAYFNSRTQIVINPNDFRPDLQASQQQLMNSIDEHYINIVVYDPLKGSSRIQLPQELQTPNKGLINLENEDNDCFRWCHIRYLNPKENNPQRIKKSDKRMVEQLNYQHTEFPVAVKHYNKIEKQNNININVFGYENKQFYPIYVS